MWSARRIARRLSKNSDVSGGRDRRRLRNGSDSRAARKSADLRGCLKSRLRVTDHRRVMPITINTDKLYDTDLTDAAWALIAPMLPAARRGGRPRTTNIRAVLNAIFYLLRTGCQWRLLPREFPVWSTVYHYFRVWKNGGVWTCVQRSMYQQARRQAGRTACPSDHRPHLDCGAQLRLAWPQSTLE